MVNNRTVVTEIGVCLGLLDWSISDGMPPVRGIKRKEWEQFEKVYSKYLDLFNLCIEQGTALGQIVGNIHTVNWVANEHSAYGKQIDIVVNDSVLISCKHDSRILYNPGPDLLFQRNLNDSLPKTGGLWFYRMAHEEYQRFYSEAQRTTEMNNFPQSVLDLERVQGDSLRRAMPSRQWPPDYPLLPYYQAMNDKVSESSAALWNKQNCDHEEYSNLFFDLFRFISNQDYWLVGRAGHEQFILQVMSREDWSSRYAVKSFQATPRVAGQAEVGWEFVIEDMSNGSLHHVLGHVQIRWSHGKNFTKNCESKVYLDSTHDAIPGYRIH